MKRSVLMFLAGFSLAACAEQPETTSPIPPPQFGVKPGNLTITMTNLGTLPGAPSSEALDINESGVIVGSSGGMGVRWQGGSMIPLPQLPGATSCRAEFINNAGVIAGKCATSIGFRTFMWINSALIDIMPTASVPTALSETGFLVGFVPGGSAFRFDGVQLDVVPGDRADGVNSLGEVVGSAGTQGFFWDGVTLTLIPTLGGFLASATDVNDAHQVVGGSLTAQGASDAFLWDALVGGVPKSLGPGGARFINEAGQVAGATNCAKSSCVFVWQGKIMKSLGNIGGPVFVHGLGEDGTIVGTGGINVDGDEHAFVSYNNGLIDLDIAGSPPTGSLSSEARASNTTGSVVGSARIGGGASRAVLWTVIKK